MLANGWYQEMQDLDSLEYISWSKIMKMHASEKHFHDRYIRGRKPDPTESQRIGKITHSALLEPDKFRANFKKSPSPDDIDGVMITVKDLKEKAEELEIKVKSSEKKADLIDILLEKDPSLRSKIWDCVMEDFKATLDEDSIKIKDSDGEKIIDMLDAVSAHPYTSKLLKGASKEVKGYYYDEELEMWLLIIPDILKLGKKACIMSDFKTTACAKNEDFGKSIANFGYHIQAAYYMDVFEKIQGRPVDEYFHIPVENKIPHICEIEYLLPEDIELGRIIWRTEARRIADIVKEHKAGKKKYWFGYSGSVKPKPSTLPHWYIKKITNDPRYFQ